MAEKLQQYTLIGNPLLFPVEVVNDVYRFELQSTSYGLWIAVPPGPQSLHQIGALTELDMGTGESLFELRSKIEYFEGSLHLNYSVNLSIPLKPTKASMTFGVGMIFPRSIKSIDDLLAKEFVRKTTYGDYGKMMHLSPLYDEADQILEGQADIYFVTRKGHNKVAIERKRGTPKLSRQQDPQLPPNL